jgi:predicted nucleic acid-binding protein
MTYLVLDASVWVPRLVNKDIFHAPVKDWMKTQRAENVEFLAPSLLLAEVGGAISRRTGSLELGQKAIEQLQNLPGLRLVEMDNQLMSESAQLAAEFGLRGANSTYAAVALRLNLPLVSLDADQKIRAGKKITVLTI